MPCQCDTAVPAQGFVPPDSPDPPPPHCRPRRLRLRRQPRCFQPARAPARSTQQTGRSRRAHTPPREAARAVHHRGADAAAPRRPHPAAYRTEVRRSRRGQAGVPDSRRTATVAGRCGGHAAQRCGAPAQQGGRRLAMAPAGAAAARWRRQTPPAVPPYGDGGATPTLRSRRADRAHGRAAEAGGGAADCRRCRRRRRHP